MGTRPSNRTLSSKKLPVTVCLSLLLTILAVFGPIVHSTEANDASFAGSSGNLAPKQETNLELRKEDLSFLIKDGKAEVQVKFQIFNPGNPKTTPLGFVATKAREGKYVSEPEIFHFGTTVNGDSVSHVTTELKKSRFDRFKETFEDDIVVYSFDAQLNSGMNTVTHRYDLGSDRTAVQPNNYTFHYTLRTGTFWANGQIEEFNLEIDVEEDNRFVEVPTNLGPDRSNQWRYIGDARFCERNDDTDHYFLKDGSLDFQAVDFKPDKELTIEVYPIARLRGGFPTDVRYLYGFSPEDLDSKFNDKKLRILRNTYFAMQGYKFNSKDLRKYFSKYCWYMPNENISAGEVSRNFSAERRHHIRKLKKLESN